MKKFKLFTRLLILIVFMGTFVMSAEGDKTKKVNKSDEKVFFYEQHINQYDYRTEKYIKFSMKILEVTPSETILKSESTIKVGDGKECMFTFGSSSPLKKPIDYKSVVEREMIIVKITPSIIKDKGIHLKINTKYYISDDAYAKFNNRKENSQSAESSSEAIAGNYEEVVIELLENKKDRKKILLKLIPFIESEKEIKNYPGVVKFKLNTPILILNDELIYRNVSSSDLISGVISEKAKKGSCFIECIIRKENKGTFILSVKPFKGMIKVGTITNKIMKFRFGIDNFELISLEQILPLEGKWNLYGMRRPKEKIMGTKLDRNPYINGKGGVYIVCVKDAEEYLPKLKDMMKYLTDAQNLADNGKYQEALKRYVWFHNHSLEHDPAMRGVRLSFALRYWKQLGDVYPPALTELKKIRDQKTSLVANGKGSRGLFIDVRGLNRTLNDNSKTVELFRIIDQKDEYLAKQCWDVVKSDVIKNKAYNVAKKYFRNFLSEFEKVKRKYIRNKKGLKKKSGVNFLRISMKTILLKKC